MDKVLLEGLLCMAHVGVPQIERERRQKILMDVELHLDLQKAGRADRMDQTVDYAAVAAGVQRRVESVSFHLVEALTESAAEWILENFPVRAVRLKVRKFSVSGTVSVGVEIVRSKKRGKSRTRSRSPKAGPR